MQISKYWITEFQNPLDSYKKFYAAVKLKGIPLVKEDYNNGFFEVNSMYAPSINSVSTVTGIPIQFVSTRTVTETKPTPRPVVSPTPSPTPPPSPGPTVNPTPENKDNGGSTLLFAALVLGLVAMSGKKKRKR